MQTACGNEKLEFQACAAGRVVVEFNGGTITPDGGVLFLKEVEVKRRGPSRSEATFIARRRAVEET